MATLTGQQIDGSYQGLIKTTDNGAISGTAKAVTDGLGNATNIEISNTSTNFVSGTVDFTGSTVSGLPTSSAGLVTGGQTNSMKSAAALTTTAAVTSHVGDIVIGEDAESKVSTGTDDYNEGGAIAIGVGAVVDKVVDYNFADTKGGIALGINAKANSGINEGGGIAIGENSKAEGTSSAIAIGSNAWSKGNFDISMGHGATANSTAIAIGKDASAAVGGWSIAIGESAGADAGGFRTGTIAIGTNNSASALDAIVIGNEGSATAAGAVALGHNVVAATVETVSVSALEVQTDSTPTAGGIIISDAGGTDRRLNIDASGALQIDSTAVGGGGAAGLVSGAGADSMKSDDSLTTGGTLARGVDDIVLGDGANSRTDASFGANIVIGAGASQTSGERNIVMGRNSVVASSTTIVIGDTAVDGGSNLSVIMGSGASTNGSDEQIVIGYGARGEANAGGISIGRDVDNGGLNAISIGRQADSSNNAIAAGYQAIASGNESAAFGYSADATAGSSVALGDRALANLTESVAIGSQVTSLWASGTTVNQIAFKNYANINFADDTAAAAGGVPLGGVYHTSGALKIRIA